jgi:hypothetical protein
LKLHRRKAKKAATHRPKSGSKKKRKGRRPKKTPPVSINLEGIQLVSGTGDTSDIIKVTDNLKGSDQVDIKEMSDEEINSDSKNERGQ